MSSQRVLDSTLIKDLSNHIYEKRKATAFQVESITKAALARNDSQTILKIIHELTDLTQLQSSTSLSSSASVTASNSAKMGAITALGSVSVALGSFAIAFFLNDIVRPIFAMFKDVDARVRYYACESLYNVAKIARGEIMLYFNEIFDVLCILVSDTESSVKNAADILDRLIKDIVSAKAVNYVSILDEMKDGGNENENENGDQTGGRGGAGGIGGLDNESSMGSSVQDGFDSQFMSKLINGQDFNTNWGKQTSYLERLPLPSGSDSVRSHSFDAQGNTIQTVQPQEPAKAFQLPKFIPVLLERMYIVDPFTKKFLLSWLELFNDIPNLELIRFLPTFLLPLIKFMLNGAPQDIIFETENLLDIFLREIAEVESVKLEMNKKLRNIEKHATSSAEQGKGDEDVESIRNKVESLNIKNKTNENENENANENANENENEDKAKQSTQATQKTLSGKENNFTNGTFDGNGNNDNNDDIGNDGGDGHSHHSLHSHDDDDGHDDDVDDGNGDNDALILQEVPFGHDIYIDHQEIIHILLSFLQGFSQNGNGNGGGLSGNSIKGKGELPDDSYETKSKVQHICLKWLRELINIAPRAILKSFSDCVTIILQNISSTEELQTYELRDQFLGFSYELQAFLNKFYTDIRLLEIFGVTEESETLFNAKQLPDLLASILKRFLSQGSNHSNELSKVTALDWFVFVYERVPTEFLNFFQNQDNEFGLTDLLKYDASDNVILKVLQLLAKVSESNQEFFRDFIAKLIKLFQSGGFDKNHKVDFIIRKLCLSLNSEIIFTTLAEVLLLEYKSDESHDLNYMEFANMMIITLNNILLTSTELRLFRRKLKSIDLALEENWNLFSTLFKSWCFDASSAISLCLLTSNYYLSHLVIKSLADLEITSRLLLQLDVLIQLLELPIFVKLRLQLLDPLRYSDLYKSLYGLLMILPQSTTFQNLRNRVSTISVFHENCGSYSSFSASSEDQPALASSENKLQERRDKDDITAKVKEKSRSLLEHFEEIQVNFEELQI